MRVRHALETQDLLLRTLEPAHARGAYAAWMRDPEVTRYLEVRLAPPDAARLESFIATANASDDNLLLGLFPRVEPGRHIGNVKLGPIDRRHDSAPLGILIGERDWRGKGLAAQAIAVVCEHAFAKLGLQRVEAGFYADNVASQRAFRRAGFFDEGRRRAARAFEGARTDEIVMGRLKDQP